MGKFVHNKRAVVWSLALVFILYAIFIGADLLKGLSCWSTGIDFCVYWSSGRAALEHGVGGVYDLDILRIYQEPLYPEAFDPTAPYEYLPFPYPPFYVLPFYLFGSIPLLQSFYLWSAVKILLFGFYLWYFHRSVSGRKFPWTIFLLIMFSANLFNDIKFGQMNAWLAIFAGEFIRNMVKGNKTWAGVWLVAIAVKFQTLVVVLPFLLLTRNWKPLMSFAIGSMGVGVISFLLVGVEGIKNFILIITRSFQGYSAANVARMMNWRMIGYQIERLTNSNIGYLATTLGMIITIYFLVNAIRKLDLGDQDQSLLAYGMVIFATTILTWHSHFEMNLIFAPFLLVAMDRGWVKRNTFVSWFWFGCFAFVIVFMINTVMATLGSPILFSKYLIRFFVFIGFVINLIMFYELTRAAVRIGKRNKISEHMPVEV